MIASNNAMDFVNTHIAPPQRIFPLFMSQPWLNAGFMINSHKVGNTLKTYWTNVPVPKVQVAAMVGNVNNYTGYATL
jgi:hypothetical protein